MTAEAFTAEAFKQTPDVRKVPFLSDLFFRGEAVKVDHEVERRFLITRIPNELLEGAEYRDMVQVYVPVTLDGKETEVRLRETYNEDEGLCLRAVEKPKGRFLDDDDADRPKGAGGIVPSSINEEAHLAVGNVADFNTVWRFHKGSPVARRRFYIPYEFWGPENGHVRKKIKSEIHLDVLRGNLESLVRAEIEFINENRNLRRADADYFARHSELWPEWFGKDVTGQKQYKSKQLFKRGMNQKWKDESSHLDGLKELLGELKTGGFMGKSEEEVDWTFSHGAQ